MAIWRVSRFLRRRALRGLAAEHCVCAAAFAGVDDQEMEELLWKKT